MKRPKCKTRDHTDRTMRGGNRSQCTKCGEIFPCRTACDHPDCRVAKGAPLPASVGAGSWEAIASELVALGYFKSLDSIPRPPPDLSPDDFGAP